MPMPRTLLPLAALTAALAACGSSASQRTAALLGASPAHWIAVVRIARVLDLSAPRADGTIVVAAAKRLALLRRSGAVEPLARGPAGYANPGGEEPYIAVSS